MSLMIDTEPVVQAHKPMNSNRAAVLGSVQCVLKAKTAMPASTTQAKGLVSDGKMVETVNVAAFLYPIFTLSVRAPQKLTASAAAGFGGKDAAFGQWKHAQ